MLRVCSVGEPPVTITPALPPTITPPPSTPLITADPAGSLVHTGCHEPPPAYVHPPCSVMLLESTTVSLYVPLARYTSVFPDAAAALSAAAIVPHGASTVHPPLVAPPGDANTPAPASTPTHAPLHIVN